MNDAWIVWASVGLGGGVLLAVFAVAASRRRLVPAAAATLIVAVCAWLVAVAAIQADLGDAGGFVDCRDSCTVPQYLAAIVFVAGPLFFVLGLAALVVAGIFRRGVGTPP